MNRTKTVILLAALTALFLFLGQAIGGNSGMMIALVIALVMNFGSYWFSDKVVLRMYHAEEVTENQQPELFNIVKRLATRAEIPMPKVYIVPEEAPNAFATGRNPQHAAVACTAGIMKLLDKRELTGVLGHELGHVLHRDTLIMTVAATLAGALGYLAQFAMFFGGGRSNGNDERRANPLLGLFAMLISMIAAPMIQMAISRSREFVADDTGAKLSDDPLALASALRKIESWSKQIPMHSGSPATSHLFIINPFSAGGMAALFRTHPSTDERVARLEAMARH